jgi:hypothetical protein
MDQSTILLMPEKADAELAKVADAWTNLGGTVMRLGKYWIRDERIAQQPIAIYGNQAFALVLAQLYNVQLLSPNDALIADIKHHWVKRRLVQKQLAELQPADFPAFVKPVIPKLFLAGIFQDADVLAVQTAGLPQTESVLVSSIIAIQAEARAFVQDGTIKDLALYEGHADLESGLRFLESFVEAHKNNLPRAVVVDIAFDALLGWLVLELNACWGAGLNGCKAEKVIGCIVAATVNQ